MPGLGSGNDEAALEGAQAREPLELAADALERVDPVAEARSVLVAPRGRELGQPPPQPG
jgi:hypothetical protein